MNLKICSVEFSVEDGIIVATDGGALQKFPQYPCDTWDSFNARCDFIFQFCW